MWGQQGPDTWGAQPGGTRAAGPRSSGNGVQVGGLPRRGVTRGFTDGVAPGEALPFPYCDRGEMQSPFLPALLRYVGF